MRGINAPVAPMSNPMAALSQLSQLSGATQEGILQTGMIPFNFQQPLTPATLSAALVLAQQNQAQLRQQHLQQKQQQQQHSLMMPLFDEHVLRQATKTVDDHSSLSVDRNLNSDPNPNPLCQALGRDPEAFRHKRKSQEVQKSNTSHMPDIHLTYT